MSAAVSYAVWAVLAVWALGLWVRSRSPSAAHARPTEVVERLATGPLLRTFLVLAWMWTGWHLFAR